MAILTNDGRFLTRRLTIPIANESNWPEVWLPEGMDSEKWATMMEVLETMRPAIVIHADRRPLMARLASALAAGADR